MTCVGGVGVPDRYSVVISNSSVYKKKYLTNDQNYISNR